MKSRLGTVALVLISGAVAGCMAAAPAAKDAAEASAAPASAPALPSEPLAEPIIEGGDGAYAEQAAPEDPGEEGAAEDEARFAEAPLPVASSKRAPGVRGAVAPTRAAPTPAAAIAHSPSPVKAGEWDDNANFREYQRYLRSQSHLSFEGMDLSARRFVVVRDRAGRGVPGCSVVARDSGGAKASLVTGASGRALLFPRAEGLRGRSVTVSAHCLGQTAQRAIDLAADDGFVDLRLAADRGLPATRTVDVVFILDTTGSMSEEIEALKGTITSVTATLRQANARPRLGLVEYRDQGDAFVTRIHQMTTDVPAFATRVGQIHADGGGDTPEHVNAGLRAAVERIRWSSSSIARLAFLIGDAPPHLDYAQDVSYQVSMRGASRRGIQIFTVAASGMDDLGQVVWRQIAQYTGGTNMFVLRGGAGPQSTGGGDPKRSCGGTHSNYTSGNLAALISGKVEDQIRALDQNPLRIAGLREDENAKPCAERLTLAR